RGIGCISDEWTFAGGIIWRRESGARLVVGPDRDFFQCLHDHRLSPLKKKAAANKASPMRITVAGDRECQRSWRMPAISAGSKLTAKAPIRIVEITSLGVFRRTMRPIEPATKAMASTAPNEPTKKPPAPRTWRTVPISTAQKMIAVITFPIGSTRRCLIKNAQNHHHAFWPLASGINKPITFRIRRVFHPGLL